MLPTSLPLTFTPPSGPTLHADVVAYRDRLIANGGTISAAALAECDRMVKSWESTGILAIVRNGLEMPFLGNNLAAALTPLFIPTGYSVTNFNFVAADWSESIGLNPGTANTTKYLDFGACHIPIVTTSSAQLTAGVQTNLNATGGQIEIGVWQGTQSRFILAARDAQAIASIYSNVSPSPARIIANYSGSAGVTGAKGLWSATRSDAENMRIVRNGATFAAAAVGAHTSAVPPSSLFGFANSISPSTTPGGFSCRVLTHLACTAGMTVQQSADYHAAIVTKDSNMGRPY